MGAAIPQPAADALSVKPLRSDLLRVLRCQICGAALRTDGVVDDPFDAIVCTGCRRHTPVVKGIPRFVETPAGEEARRTQASFGYEWTHFNDWRESGSTNFGDYFQGVDLGGLSGATVLDAGCGMGRHARLVAEHVKQVVAVDFSSAIEQARRNTAEMSNVDCVQADLLSLPLADEAFDFVYSLGVLHHLVETETALKGLVKKLKPGGRLRVYLYWKRHGWKGRLLDVATAARRLTVRMPFRALRVACWALSVALFCGVIVPYRILTAAGVRAIEQWPLFVYAKYPFYVLYNDQFDRFSAPIEKRYDPAEIRELLLRAGLVDVTVRPCFGWIADAIKPA
jgi:SAM-dependent methyltransferase